MTLQEIYNKVRDHLLTQGKKSQFITVDGMQCMYRAPDGCKCAVGVLITDEAYSPGLENDYSVWPVIAALVESGIDAHDGPTQQLLSALQKVHDGRNVENWPSALRFVAQENGLQP